MVARGDARFISRDEMLAFLDRADRDGLVVEPQNTRNPQFICCCCGCCCGVLATARKLPRPAEFFATSFVARVVAEACHGCGACVDRCQMAAIACDGDPAVVQAERCIGCGLCVTTCPTGALRLHARPDGRIPPSDTGRLYARMFRERFGVSGLVSAVGRRVLGLKS
jgi:ferredoxin